MGTGASMHASDDGASVDDSVSSTAPAPTSMPMSIDVPLVDSWTGSARVREVRDAATLCVAMLLGGEVHVVTVRIRDLKLHPSTELFARDRVMFLLTGVPEPYWAGVAADDVARYLRRNCVVARLSCHGRDGRDKNVILADVCARSSCTPIDQRAVEEFVSGFTKSA